MNTYIEQGRRRAINAALDASPFWPTTLPDAVRDMLNGAQRALVQKRGTEAMAYCWGRQDAYMEAGLSPVEDGPADLRPWAGTQWRQAEEFRNHAMREAILYHAEVSPSLDSIEGQWDDFLSKHNVKRGA